MSRSSQVLDVAAGVVYDTAGRVLVAQRSKEKLFPGKWEFPGGKIQDGESVAEALTRELDEELGIRVERQRSLVSFTHGYDALTVHLHVNEVLAYDGVPESREGQRLRWVDTGKLEQIDMLDANIPVVRMIALPRICLITDTQQFGIRHTLDLLEKHVEQQPVLLIVREKAMPKDRLDSFVGNAVDICHRSGALVCVHVDSAFSDFARVDAVHLSAESFRRQGIQRLASYVGVSCHSAGEVQSAFEHGADYALLSPVSRTRSHPSSAGMGWAEFARARGTAPIPAYALGGLRFSDLQTALRHGAQGIAMLSAAWKD